MITRFDVQKLVATIPEGEPFSTIWVRKTLGSKNKRESDAIFQFLSMETKAGRLVRVKPGTYVWPTTAKQTTAPTTQQPKPVDMDNLSLTETGQAIYALLKKQDKKIADLHEELNYAIGENAELEQTIRRLQERLHECNEQLTKAGQGSKRFSLHELQSHVNGGK